MKESIVKIQKSILSLLDEDKKKQLPRRIVELNLSTQYKIEDVKETITNLLNDFTIDLVVDYPPNDSELDTGHPHWFLKLLSPSESKELSELSPLKLSFLRILQETDDDVFPGQVPVDEIKAKLISKGFSDDEVEWLHITDRVYRISTTRFGGWCYMIIPEYEKTEEYKKAEEEMHREWNEKEARRMYYADVNDLADQILTTVKGSPDGISKKEIVKQLFMSDPEYVNHAFEIEVHFDDILPITMNDDVEGYRLHPEYDGE